MKNKTTQTDHEYTHFYATGLGKTENEALLDFAGDLINKLPKKTGLYDFYIRVPVTGTSEDSNYSFYMRGSYKKNEK